jgi:hypothetical protein
MKLQRRQPRAEPLIEPCGEKKKHGFWNRLLKHSECEYQLDKENVDANGHRASAVYDTQVPIPVSYDKCAALEPSVDNIITSYMSSPQELSPEMQLASPTETLIPTDSSFPPKSPISSFSLASTRSSVESRGSTVCSSANNYPHQYRADDQLVITLTSKYPTGIAADLYEPEVTIVPKHGIMRSLSTKSYKAKHAVYRSYSKRASKPQRQSWHF